jgi:hypothetical protein
VARVLPALLCLLLLPALSGAEELRVVAWNTESGDADPVLLAERIRDEEGVDLWGLSEVEPDWAERFRRAAGRGRGGRFESLLGSTGGSDRLLILYDSDRFERVAHFELHEINPERRVRSPLVAHFRVRANGLEFLFMVNHLYRSRADRRLEQSLALRAWAEARSLPLIAVGDYNYDWHFERGETEHDPGYDALVEGGVFRWVRPALLVPTHCGRRQNVLDFVFTSGPAGHWRPTSRILDAQPSFCPDDSERSDHRPVAATFDLDLAHRLALRDASLERIAAIEAELEILRGLIGAIE